jgi:hypothetical protein
LRWQQIEIVDDRIGFGVRAGMRKDRLEQVAGAAVMQEEDALADPPQGSGTKLLPIGVALRDAIRQSKPHIVDSKVAERTQGHGAAAAAARKEGEPIYGRRLLRHMAGLAANVIEDLTPAT